MKEKIINFLNSKFFFAVALNIIIFIFCIGVSSFSYDSIDDFYNSLYICHYHYYYNNDINYILATIIGSVQYILNGFNCYVLALSGLSLIAFISMSYVFADKYGKNKSLAFSLLVNILFSINHYADVHSTKTAALLLATGFLLVFNAIRNKRYNLPFWIGITEITLGSFFDCEYFFIAFGFAVAYFIADMISKKKYKIAPRKFFWYSRPFFLSFILICLVVLSLNQYTISVNNSSDEASNYYEYCELTDSINNLPYPNYKDYKDEFNEVGITSENDYELLKNGYYDADASLNNKALRLVYDIQQQNNSKTLLTELGNIFVYAYEHFISFDSMALIMLVYAVIAVIYIILQKNRFSFFPMLYAIAAVAAGVYIRFAFSGATYLTYGIWLIMFAMLINSFDFNQIHPKRMNIFMLANKGKVLIAYGVILCLFVSYCAIYQTHYVSVNMKNRPSSLYLEISKHPERYYLLDPATSEDYIKYTDNYIHPLWGFKSSFMNNVDGFGYYCNTDQRRKFNLPDNVYQAAISSRYVYIIDNSITFKKEKYFTSYYAENGCSATYISTDEISGFKIYKVVSK